MHAALYNEAIFSIRLTLRSPLLIKSGSSGKETLDPTLPDMAFVRTQRPDRAESEVYIPGSSLRGVIRSHAEKLIRSVMEQEACNPLSKTNEATAGGGVIRAGCYFAQDSTKVSGSHAYLSSCYACKLFGNTALAGRARIGDLYLPDLSKYTETDKAKVKPLFETRYGVAIDRVTGSVAQGPFELELLTDAQFEGHVTIRNYTLGQLGLLASAILDIGDGLVPMGCGKSRGLGRVNIRFEELQLRTVKKPEGNILGVGALAEPRTHDAYRLPSAEMERIEWQDAPERERGFWRLHLDDTGARSMLETAANLWVDELEMAVRP